MAIDINLLKECGHIRSINEDSFLCLQGEEGHSMYIVLSGSVRIVLNAHSDKPHEVGTVSAGGYVGEMSLLENKPRSATIIAAQTPTIILEISEKDFPMLLQKSPDIAFMLLNSLNKRLDEMLKKIGMNDKKYEFQYRKNPYYIAIQSLDETKFKEFSENNGFEKIWTLLKFLSSSLNNLNQAYIEHREDTSRYFIRDLKD